MTHGSRKYRTPPMSRLTDWDLVRFTIYGHTATYRIALNSSRGDY